MPAQVIHAPPVILSHSDDHVIRAENSEAIAVAVSAKAAEMAMEANYQELLKAMIFKREERSRQPLSAFEKVLMSARSHRLLWIVWQESKYVPDETLHNAGLEKHFGDKLCAYKLAVELATRKETVGATNTMIRTFGAAAASFGLIDRREISSNLVYLRGTATLHEFMMVLVNNNLEHYQNVWNAQTRRRSQ